MTTILGATKESSGARTTPLYTIPEAAHLARVSPATVRSWLYGSEGKASLFEASPSPMVSFLQLIELVVAANFRKTERVSLSRLRNAYLNAKQVLRLEYPFAYEQLEVVGGHIVRFLHTTGSSTSYQSMDEPTQWTLPGLLVEVKRKIIYEDKLAARWYPVGDEVPIVIDPRITSGIPTIQDRGVTVHAIRKRFLAGQEIAFIARDYEIEEGVVEFAVRYGEQVAA